MPFWRKRLGLELNDTLLKLVQVKQRHKSLEVQKVVAHPFPSIWSEDGIFIEEAGLIETIREALAGHKFASKKVHVAIHSRHVYIQKHQIPIMKKRKRKEWIQENLIPTLGLPVRNVTFDWYVIKRLDLEELDEIMLVIAAKEYVNKLVRIIEKCGLEPISLEVSALGLHRWLMHQTKDLSNHYLSIHVALNGVELSCFKDGELQDVSFVALEAPSFRHHFDQPPRDPLEPIMKDESEIEAYGKQLLEEMGPILSIWQKILQWEPTQWVLTGDAIDLKQMQSYLETQVGGKEMVIGPANRSVLSQTVKEQASQWLGNAFSVPIGLLLKERSDK
ncbi:pilus assembly protein PilM [Hazenella sp. IB182353]|uniref:type IV pilus biogenesis protein PilM n=1 Tax=Polycladospora coralii TaxID=2771432 RepID=UPI001747C37A|nr:pilus assembly protein PilM [Polycladospora coralii]MBS7529244.1 pilus assembly protein PilM [Polycladospora coralii]